MSTRGKSTPERDGRRNDTRSRLVEHALQLLVRDGYEAATTGRIAKAAGIRQSSFYSHFPSRDACLVEAVTREADTLIARLSERRRALPRLSRGTRATRDAVRAGFVMTLAHLTQRDELRTLIMMRDAGHPAGQAVRDALARLRDALVADLGRFDVEPSADDGMRVELLMALTFQATSGVVEGRYPLPDVVEVLTQQATALFER